MSEDKSNVKSIPELTDFKAEHSSLGGFVMLNTSFRDPMDKWFTPVEYPDVLMSIKLKDAKRLIALLQKSVSDIERGIDSPGSTTF